MCKKKKLSWLLRHSTDIMRGIDGWVDCELLTDYTIDELKNITDKDDKRRFQIKTIDTSYHIRAVQGHSLIITHTDNSLKPYIGHWAIHITNPQNISGIKSIGLSRMNRQHIHMHMHYDNSMLKKNKTVIYVNILKAMNNHGIRFYTSTNGYVLSSGNDYGIIPIDCLVVN